uniref:Bromo domain-containing protein n=1 Tax=Hucho hucho TaxID=62062 RepID=A0A4W5R651_9TELE
IHRERQKLSMPSPSNPAFVSKDFRLDLSDSIVSHRPGSVHYDEGESEAERIHHSMDMNTPIFQLYEAVWGGRNSQGHSELFMVKPSKKDYLDYYKIILEPMDLKTIDHNIRSEKYMTEGALLEDMKLMFHNARHYNEEGSQVMGQSEIRLRVV